MNKTARLALLLFILAAFQVMATVTASAAVCSVNSVTEGQYIFDMPGKMTATPDGKWVLVTDEMSGNLKIVNTGTNTVEAQVYLSVSPAGIVVSNDGKKVFISDSFSGNIDVVDISSDSLDEWNTSDTWTVKNAGYLGPMVADGNRLYAADVQSGAIHVLSVSDGSEEASNLTDGNGQCSLPSAMTIENNTLFVSCESGNVVSVYDISGMSFTKNIKVGNGPVDLALSTNGAFLYTANKKGDSVSVIDASTFAVIATVENKNIFTTPSALAATDGVIWIADQSGAQIAKLNTQINDVEAGTCSGVGRRPSDLVTIPGQSIVYVAHSTGVDYFSEGLLKIYAKKSGETSYTWATDLIVSPEEVFDIRVDGGAGPFDISGSGGLSANQTDASGRYFSVTAPELTGNHSLYVEDKATGDIKTLFLRVGGGLTVSPSTINIEVGGQSIVVEVSGGFPPYSWNVENGFISAYTGRYVVYTPQITGEGKLTVTDASGSTVTIPVNISFNGLRITPATAVMTPGEQITFNALDGASYQWEAPIGGSLSETEGDETIFTAPNETGEYRLILTDVTDGSIAQAIIYVVRDSLDISPGETVVERNGTATFFVTGGKGPYLWTVGEGDLLNTSGVMAVYSASEISGFTTVKVMDAGGRVASAKIEIKRNLMLSPVAPSAARGESITFKLSGAVGDVVWSTSEGELSGQSGGGAVWKAPERSGRFFVWAADADGSTVQSIITVLGTEISVTPSVFEAKQGESSSFTVSGGGGPYVWSAETGILSASEGKTVFWTAPDWIPDEAVKIFVEDSSGTIAQAEVTVTPRDEAVIRVNNVIEHMKGGDRLYLQFRAAGPGEWDAYVSILLPFGLEAYFNQTWSLMTVPAKWEADGFMNGGWQSLLDFTLPEEGLAIPEGSYTLKGILVPKGMDLNQSLSGGSAVSGDMTFDFFLSDR